MKAITLAADVYWRLPGPMDFIHRIASNAGQARILFLNMPYGPLLWIWPAVQKGLQDAHIGEVIPLTISAGMDIGSQIGIQLGRNRISAAELVGFPAPVSTAFILIPGEPEAGENCSGYATEFMEQVGRVPGNVTLAVVIHEEDLVTDNNKDGVHVITFDGSLTADEMDAYVSLRMLGQPGPGSTRLNRSLVSEFAGFDVDFAERLIKMDPSIIIGLGNDTAPLLKLIDEDRARWHQDSWLNRTHSVRCPNATHTLHDLFLLNHGSAAQIQTAEVRLRRRYWRACLRVLTPWLEERRMQVLDVLMLRLKAFASMTNGKIEKKVGNHVEQVAPEDLEYNDIAYRYQQNHIVGVTYEEKLAIDVCVKAKLVRNDIAHMKMPRPDQIVTLISMMDRLIPDSST